MSRAISGYSSPKSGMAVAIAAIFVAPAMVMCEVYTSCMRWRGETGEGGGSN